MADRYWVGGTGTWNTTSTTNWSATSGGASGASVPTVADSVFFDQASTYTVTMTGALACLNFNVTGGTVTFQNGTSPTLDVRGSWSTVAATVWNTTGAITFSATTSRTITTNAITIRSPITFNGAGGTWTLQDNVTLLSTLTTTLSAGTLALNNFTLSTGIFTSTTTTTRVITFGTTGQITITGNAATVLSMATLTGFTYTGTARIYSSYSGATGTRTFLLGSSAGAVPTNVFNVSFDTSGTGLVIAPATDTVSLQGVYFNADFTNLTNTVSNDTRFFYGNLTVPASGGTFTAGANVTHIVAGIAVNINVQRTLDFPFSVNSVGGTLNFLNNFTIGSTRTFTLTAGTLSFSTYTISVGLFSSSGSTARVLAFGTGQLALTGNAATIFDITTATNFSTTGTVYINSTYTGSTGTRTFVTGFTAAQAASYIVSTSGTDGIVLSPSATDIVALTGNYNNIDFTGFTGTLSNTARTIYGNLTMPASGGTFTAGALVTTFAATSGTKTITTNSRTLDFPVTINGTGGTFQLQDALTLGSTRAFTLTAGTLNLNDFTLSAVTFSSNNSNTRSVAFGTTGKITLGGNNATIVDLSTMTNFTYTGTPKIYSTYTGATGTRTFNIGNAPSAGATSTNVFDLSIGTSGNGLVIAAGTDTLVLIGSFNDFNLTGLAQTINNNSRFIYGNFTLPASGGTLAAGVNVLSFLATSGTKTITTNGRTLDFPVTISGTGGTFQLLSNFTLGSTRAFTLTAGTLDLNDFTLSLATFSSSGTGVRSVAFGTTGLISLGGNNATIVDLTDITNFTYTGTPKIYSTYTGATGTRTFNFGGTGAIGVTSTNIFDLSIGTSGNGLVIAAGTDTLSLAGGFNNFDLTGMTHTLVSNTRFIYGDFTIPASGGTLSSGTAINSFVGVSGTKNITTNGRTLDFPITLNGAATFRLQSALLQGSTRALTHTNGTIDLNGYTLTVGTAYTTATGTKNLTFNGGSLVCPTASATAFNNAVPGGFTTTAGTGTGVISLTAATAKTFVGGGITYLCDIDQSGAGALTITGLNTFNRIKSSYANTTANASIILPTGNTTTLAGIVGGSASNKMLDLGSATATAAPFRANVIISNSSIQTTSYVQTNNIVFITNTANTFSANGTTPWRLYLANSINNGDTLGAVFQEYSNSAPIVYYITGGTSFTVPVDWDNSNNAVHIYGAGGGSSGSYVPNSSGNRLGSAGGGGGGYTQVLNLTATPGNSLSYNIGSGGAAGSANTIGSGGNGGNTTFAGIYTANGGGGSSITSSTTTAGTGGTGATANGGIAGLGGGAASQTNNSSGGGGGGSGGPNGAGANGGTGVVAADPSTTPGGGGGGSGGGINGASVLFDGTGDYLNTSNNAAFTFDTGDLTIEGWIYQTATSTSTYRVIFADNVYGSTGGYTLYSYNNALNLWKGSGGGGAEVIAPAGTITLNTWTHIAWTRSGSSNRLFINGTQVGATTTDSTNYTSTASFIGASRLGTFGFAGYISNARILKGTALYTANFTPPASSLTNIANTSLLTCRSATFVDNGPNNFTITVTGNSSVSSFSPFGNINAVATIPGTGGNSFIGVRVGGTGGLANTFAGVIGRERGRASYDILGSIGGSGGGGGGGATGPSIRDGLNIGGGAGGSGATDSDFANPGTAGQSGGIIIVYYPSAVVSGNFSNMFLVF